MKTIVYQTGGYIILNAQHLNHIIDIVLDLYVSGMCLQWCYGVASVTQRSGTDVTSGVACPSCLTLRLWAPLLETY